MSVPFSIVALVAPLAFSGVIVCAILWRGDFPPVLNLRLVSSSSKRKNAAAAIAVSHQLISYLSLYNLMPLALSLSRASVDVRFRTTSSSPNYCGCVVGEPPKCPVNGPRWISAKRRSRQLRRSTSSSAQTTQLCSSTGVVASSMP